MSKHTSLVVAAFAMALLAVGVASPALSGQAPAAGVDAWVARNPKLAKLRFTMTEPAFTIDFPKKDWVVAPGGGAATLVLVQTKGEASVIVERAVLKAELGPGDITDLFAQLETEAIQQRTPKAADFKSKVLDVGTARRVVVQYVVAGAKGPERAGQYSIPAGTDLYRVTCSAPIAQFAVYDPIFAHMAASFAPGRRE